MNARTLTLPAEPAPSLDADPNAQRRFGAIVRALRAIASSRRSAAAIPAAQQRVDVDELLAPTRRINRVRRLLGRIPVVGKSRAHARPR